MITMLRTCRDLALKCPDAMWCTKFLKLFSFSFLFADKAGLSFQAPEIPTLQNFDRLLQEFDRGSFATGKDLVLEAESERPREAGANDTSRYKVKSPSLHIPSLEATLDFVQGTNAVASHVCLTRSSFPTPDTQDWRRLIESFPGMNGDHGFSSWWKMKLLFLSFDSLRISFRLPTAFWGCLLHFFPAVLMTTLQVRKQLLPSGATSGLLFGDRRSV